MPVSDAPTFLLSFSLICRCSVIIAYNSHVCVQTFLKTETVQSSRRLFR